VAAWFTLTHCYTFCYVPPLSHVHRNRTSRFAVERKSFFFEALTNTVGGGEGGSIKYLKEQAFPLLPPYSAHFFLSSFPSLILFCFIVIVIMYFFSSLLSLSQFTTVFLQLNVIVRIYYSIPPAHCLCQNLLQYSSSSLSLSEFTTVFLQLIVIVRIYYSIPPAHCHCRNLVFLLLIVIVTIYYSSSSLSLSGFTVPP
jgi:hypothetical protein